MTLAKAERFAEFLRRIEAAPPARSGEDATKLVSEILNEVEDQLTSIPFNPALWMEDGRMYPPQPDSARLDADQPELVRYRSRAHNTWIHSSGAIRIEKVGGECLLNKPAHNGQTIDR